MSHVLMICHDQNLDRRVVAQASSLIAEGQTVTLLALSFGAEDEEKTTVEGIHLVRISLNKIIPGNATYKSYSARQERLNSLLSRSCNYFPRGRSAWNAGFRLGSRFNRLHYRQSLLVRYRNTQIADPLPFTSAFVVAGSRYPADVVQVHDLPGLEAGVRLAEQWRVPIVYDAHELYPEQRSFSSAQRRICTLNEAKLITKTNLVFAVNESIGKKMQERYGISKPVTLLNAIDPPDGFDPTQKYDLLHKKLSLPTDRRIVLFQGGFAPHRNLDLLIKAMLLVKTPKVDLVMMGFGDFGEFLKARARKLGLLDKRVHFLPAVPQSELLQHSASADFGIIPYPHVDLNSYFCTPNKLFEFIEAGLPILANDSPELRRFVVEQGFGISKSMGSARQIAEAIDCALASDPDSWKRSLLEKRATFTWRQQSSIYLEGILPLLTMKKLNRSNHRGSYFP